MIKQLMIINGKQKWVIWGEREKIVKRIIRKLIKYERERKQGINIFHLVVVFNNILEDVRKIIKIDK